MDTFDIIKNMEKADNDFSAAIKKQFGKHKNRFDVDSKKFSAETKEKYKNKLFWDEKFWEKINFKQEK